LLLFFGRLVLLTPIPLTINASCINFHSNKPLRVITSGAYLEIRIAADSNGTSKVTNPVASSKVVEKIYPTGTVTAELLRTDGATINALNNDLGTANNFYGLILQPPRFFIEGDKYYDVKVCSKVIISSAEIYWHTAME